MVEYNPDVLQKYADKIYQEAYFQIVYWAIVGLIGGVIVGIFIQAPLTDIEEDLGPQQELLVDNVCFVFLIIGLGIGVTIGYNKTLEMRKDAQLILCMRAIELNQRGGVYPR